MLTLVVERDAIRFPSRCVECEGPASEHYSLKVPRDPRALAVPVCQRCSERKSLGQFLWIAASALVGVGFVIGLAVAADELIAIVPGLRAMTGVLVLACFLAGAVPVVLALLGGRRSYHRRFSAAWVEARGSGSTAVILGFRSDELRRAVASLSGIPVLGAAPFREDARMPDAFQKPEGPASIPAWSVILVGLAMIVAGVVRYWDIGKQESRALSMSLYWPEWILYKVAGRAGVLSLFLVAGVATTLLGAALFRRGALSARDALSGMISLMVGVLLRSLTSGSGRGASMSMSMSMSMARHGHSLLHDGAPAFRPMAHLPCQRPGFAGRRRCCGVGRNCLARASPRVTAALWSSTGLTVAT